jgi:hypothetical protein
MPLGRLKWEDETVQVEYDNSGVLKLLGSPGPKLFQAFVNMSGAILVMEDGQQRVIHFESFAQNQDITVRFFFG